MSFPCTKGELQTKDTFNEQIYEEHHKGVSPLLNLDLDLENQVPLDPMHLVYLVIEFSTSDGQKPEVEVVPNTWLHDKEDEWYCLWPQALPTKQIRKAIEKAYMPEEDWACYNCRILYTCERDHSVLKIRFEKAKSLLSEFEDVHLEIEVIEDKGDEGARQLFEDCYYEYIAKAQELLDSEERSAAVNRNEAEQAEQLKEQIVGLLSSGGFHLRKWASNHPRFNETEEHVCLDSFDIHKTLGILWNPRKDCLLYRVSTQQDEGKMTKRSILAQVASLYDPLGLIGPVIVQAKIIIQSLWKLQLTWDEPVPEEICTVWEMFQRSKSDLNNITLPRQVCIKQAVILQLHGFADASEAAYGACIYMRSANACQSRQVVLVCSKSRVAPLKKLSLPKLELCTALLLVELYQTVLKAFDTVVNKVVFWSDSSIVLQWIRTPPHRLKTFVANRVVIIQEISEQYEWRHVSSHDNPADLVSRGSVPADLVNNTLWFNGPKWLSENENSCWPASSPAPAEVPEQRMEISLKTERRFDLLRRFSSITRLRRVVAWCFRFVSNCRNKCKSQGRIVKVYPGQDGVGE
ncbi:hypothetical protein DMN91_002197 [Ooceraea biroi]|uniref:Uncharacterized protein n=1 Tax=Ooceraea biroi TaxID=2015173 RepID=A0A3L8E009_OOCBI|nr:hypothetical protein DMN91_002197 [Ooceraea biroi]